jgi:hypothetical protein
MKNWAMVTSCCHCLLVAKSRRKRKKGDDTPMPSHVVTFVISNAKNKSKKKMIAIVVVFFFSSRRKKKNTEKKNVNKGGSLPFFSYFSIWDEALHLLCPLHVPSMLSFPLSSSLVYHVFSKLRGIQALLSSCNGVSRK